MSKTNAVKARQFDRANPEVYTLFKRYANTARRKGIEQYSATSIFERIRWDFEVEQGKTFKINNNHKSYFARKLMKEDTKFANFFRTREG